MLVFRCKEHKSYRVEQKPKVACNSCWFLWMIKDKVNINVRGTPLEILTYPVKEEGEESAS